WWLKPARQAPYMKRSNGRRCEPSATIDSHPSEPPRHLGLVLAKFKCSSSSVLQQEHRPPSLQCFGSCWPDINAGSSHHWPAALRGEDVGAAMGILLLSMEPTEKLVSVFPAGTSNRSASRAVRRSRGRASCLDNYEIRFRIAFALFRSGVSNPSLK